jgi:hypothetical protein
LTLFCTYQYLSTNQSLFSYKSCLKFAGTLFRVIVSFWWSRTSLLCFILNESKFWDLKNQRITIFLYFYIQLWNSWNSGLTIWFGSCSHNLLNPSIHQRRTKKVLCRSLLGNLLVEILYQIGDEFHCFQLFRWNFLKIRYIYNHFISFCMKFFTAYFLIAESDTYSHGRA